MRTLRLLQRRFGITGRHLVIAVPSVWLLLFFLIPFLIVLEISFAHTRLGAPPYTPLWEWTSEHALHLSLSAANYLFLARETLYLDAFLSSIKVALISTFFCLLVAYPMAYGIARSSARWRNTLLLLVVLPFWTSFLVRVYAWIGLLRNNGLINNVLMALGLIHEPIVMMQTDFAMYIGIVYSYLPFMILPLYSNLEKHDNTLLEAAVNLGATPFKAFLQITLPLSLPGMIAGSMLVFIPAVGEFVIPRLLGGNNTLMIGRVLWDEFFNNRNWPQASAVAMTLLLVLVLPIMIFQRYQAREAGAGLHRWRRAMSYRRSRVLPVLLSMGFAFLYIPILSVIVYSFNNSRLVTVWGGFSARWYGVLLADRRMLEAAWLSLRIATVSATVAAILGTLAGLVLARFGQFRGRTILSGMVSAPLVMPEVITGLSLLLLFVAFAPLPFVPHERGFSTIVIAHVTLTMAYVAVIVQSRLSSLDESLEEAAMDLGARPERVFIIITLPIIAPAIASGWLLAFTLSLDDLVITTFTAGPSTSTLPMIIFSKVRLGVTPEINALATLMITLVAALVVAAGMLMARKEKSHQRDMYLAQGAGDAL